MDEEIGGRPSHEHGRKITNSSFRDEAAKMLLTDKCIEATCRFLQSKGLKVSNRTVKAFRDNYVTILDQQVKDKLLEEATQRAQEEQTKVVEEVCHYKLTTVESTIELLKVCQKQLTALQASCTPSNTFQLTLLCTFVDKIKFLREYLSQLQAESEVELEREKAITDCCDIAFQFFKDRPEDAEAFIQQISDYKSRKQLLPQVTQPATSAQ